MKLYKLLFWLMLIMIPVIIIGRGWNPTPAPVSAAMMEPQRIATEYPTLQPTNTPIPSATVDYMSTADSAQQKANIAQATADEARRINAQATAQHETYLLSIAQLTAEQDRREFDLMMGTATAAGTYIPMTQTQQSAINTQIPAQQAIISAQMTATQYAPTQALLLARAENQTRYGWMSYTAQLLFAFCTSIFCIGLVIYIFRRAPREVVPVREQPKETIVQMRTQTGQGSFAQAKLIIPCTPDQLTELSEMVVVDNERTFGINRLENTSRTLKSQRNVLYQFREFLLKNKLAFPPKPGEISLNDNGVIFLTAWFETHALSDEYEFAKQKIEIESA